MKQFFKKFKTLSLTCASGLFLGGCAIGTPFQNQPELKAFNDSDMVVVAITRAVRGDNEEQNKLFWSNSSNIIETLKNGEHAGFLGHSVRTEILGSTSWTMTVWENEESLNAFVQSPVHTTAMREAYSGLADARFMRTKRPVGDIPLTWEEADMLLDQQARGY